MVGALRRRGRRVMEAHPAALSRLAVEDRSEDRAVLAGQLAQVALRARDRARREAVMALLADGWLEEAPARRIGSDGRCAVGGRPPTA